MKKVSLCAISDTHGHIPKNLPNADILVIAGDFTAMDTEKQNADFLDWVESQPHKHRIIVPGNHDSYIEKHLNEAYEHIVQQGLNIQLLVDEAVTVEGIKFWGTPWTIRFPGQNPDCMAFTVANETAMMEKCNAIPDDTDILVTHSPPYGILDQCPNGRVGSQALRRTIAKVKPRQCYFGHIHSDRGSETKDGIEYHNVSYVDEQYRPHDKPIRVIEILLKIDHGST